MEVRVTPETAKKPDEKLWVVGILHGRRNPRLMAAILRNRQ